MWASVVFPRPGGPVRRTWSSGSPRPLAAARNTERFSRTLFCPMYSDRIWGRSFGSTAASSSSAVPAMRLRSSVTSEISLSSRRSIRLGRDGPGETVGRVPGGEPHLAVAGEPLLREGLREVSQLQPVRGGNAGPLDLLHRGRDPEAPVRSQPLARALERRVRADAVLLPEEDEVEPVLDGSDRVRGHRRRLTACAGLLHHRLELRRRADQERVRRGGELEPSQDLGGVAEGNHAPILVRTVRHTSKVAEILFGTASFAYEGWKGIVYHDRYRESTFKVDCLREYTQYAPFRT